jgi:hypothetical protein
VERRSPKEDEEVPHNMTKKDVIRATDFNFLMVLGKGSFGKVIIISSNRARIGYNYVCVCYVLGNVGRAERDG